MGTLPSDGEMDAYERLLGDAMAGDATLFAREDYVEEARSCMNSRRSSFWTLCREGPFGST